MSGTHFCSITIFIFIFSIISLTDVWGQRLKKCAEIDEYCQLPTDCCSNSCLSFLYRCTRNSNDGNTHTLFGENNPPAGTVNDVLDFTFKNAGSVREMQNNRIQQNSQSFPASNPHHHHIENSQNFGNVHTHSRYRRDVADVDAGQQKSEGDNVAAENKETSDTVAADCKAIGLKCYTNDECCSKRCHGFLHQCVT